LPKEDEDDEYSGGGVAVPPPIYWWMLSSDTFDTMGLLEVGHGSLGDVGIVDRLNGYRAQGSEGLVYSTPDGLRATWGEHGPTTGLPPAETEIVRNDIGLITKRRKLNAPPRDGWVRDR
jgi:hypothetical protein